MKRRLILRKKFVFPHGGDPVFFTAANCPLARPGNDLVAMSVRDFEKNY